MTLTRAKYIGGGVGATAGLVYLTSDGKKKRLSNNKVASLKSHLIVGGLSAIGGGVGVAALKNKQHKKLDVWDPDHPDYPNYLKTLNQTDPYRYSLVTTGHGGGYKK